jgi:hypothetical protein
MAHWLKSEDRAPGLHFSTMGEKITMILIKCSPQNTQKTRVR